MERLNAHMTNPIGRTPKVQGDGSDPSEFCDPVFVCVPKQVTSQVCLLCVLCLWCGVVCCLDTEKHTVIARFCSFGEDSNGTIQFIRLRDFLEMVCGKTHTPNCSVRFFVCEHHTPRRFLVLPRGLDMSYAGNSQIEVLR
mmetsp:Transcript_22325/g.25716  ORF Transcript_22325/g.25716 Transcript_22325/m.25716 type:complete len:140 (+) Transcript_22325:485-904(+)